MFVLWLTLLGSMSSSSKVISSLLSACSFFDFSDGCGGCIFVEQMPCRSKPRYPLCVASEKNNYVRTCADVSFHGRELRCPASKALQKVEIAGQKGIAW